MVGAKLGWNWPGGSAEIVKDIKCLKTNGHTDGQTPDKKWSEKLTWALCSGKLK